MPQRSDQQAQSSNGEMSQYRPLPQEQAGEVTTRRAGGASPTPNRRKRRAAAWRTKLKGKEGVDGNHHPLPALEDLEPPRAKVVLRPGPGKAEHYPRLAKVQGVWEAGAEQQLWTCADRAWSMSAFVAVAAPRLTPAALVLKVFEGMTTRDSRLGLATPGTLTDCF